MVGGLYLLALLVVFATVGRQSVPKRERAALPSWTLRDLYYNVRRGLTVLGEHGPTYPALEDTERPLDPRTH
ncbi:hypothetical protein ACH9D2_15590 [Kocuria sp. M4R2S49]|uniref:hypothetical protein n=1 Tax=Kocuria rhizosphaericola TaxID=3376284 RepID=UPI0037B5942B